MAVRTLVTAGFGNGTFSGTIPLVVTRGYAISVLAAKQAGVAYLSGLADELESYEEPETEQEAYGEIDEIFNRVGKVAFQPINQRMDDIEYTPERLDKLTKDVSNGLREVLK
jgi:hypothetical protein